MLNCAKPWTHLHAEQKDLMKNVSVTAQKTSEHLSLISYHPELPNRGESNEEGRSSATSPGLIVLSRFMEEGPGRLLTITCWAVHHVGCHAVRRSLRVHQARAVVHWLSVGGAGSHNAALIHGRKIALPRRGEHTYNISLQTSLLKMFWFVTERITYYL